MNFKDKKIAVWGQGREGQALLDFFQKQGVPVTVVEGQDVDLSAFDLIFKSPGISLYNKSLDNIDRAKVSSSTKLYQALKDKSVRTVAVTGTKGKSTTSSLLAHLLKSKGYNVLFGGNIGVPLISLYGQKADFLVAELSSYQCADLTDAFDVNVLLNLYPEHVDWHTSHENYYRDKANLIRCRHPRQMAVLNRKDKKTSEILPHPSDAVYFNDDAGVHMKDGFFMDGTKRLFSTESVTSLIGEHNMENICAVLTVLKILGISLAGIEKDINTFSALPHRLQTVAVKEGVTFVDDSISTTPETAVAALKAYAGRRIFLLVGGFDRKQDYETLFDYLSEHGEVTLLCLPDTGKRVFERAQEKGVSSFYCETMASAVERAKMLAKSGDVVILSPAAPSYHLYRNFEARGLDFQKNI